MLRPVRGGSTALIRLKPADSLEEGVRRLAWALEAPAPDARLARYEQPVPTTEPLAWLARTPGTPRIYFGTPGGRFALAGAGVCEQERGADAACLSRLLQATARGEARDAIRVLVVARGDPTREAEAPWSCFAPYWALLPLVEMRREGDATVLAAHLRLGESATEVAERDAQIREAQRLLTPARRPAVAHAARGAADADADREQAWRARASEVQAALARWRLGRVVVCEGAAAPRAEGVDPFLLLRRLSRALPRGYAIGVQPEPGVALLAPTPVRLYARDDLRIETDVQVGFAPRRDERKADARSADALLENAQAHLEHESVRLGVRATLNDLLDQGSDLLAPIADAQPEGHRLYSRVSGHAPSDALDAQILTRLHPGPQSAGLPPRAALAYLRRAEALDRGLIGGFVGCFGHASGEAALLVRAVLQVADEVQLLATVGIAQGTDLGARWEELRAVFRLLASALAAPDEAPAR
jgi:isochorismate synthase EntC